MKKTILIVEDEFIVANDLRIMLEKAGYKVCGIAPSVAKAIDLIKTKNPDWILLDIFLQGAKTGIDLAGQLKEMHIPFIYISANTNQAILESAKATEPYGFLVKPFREKDLLIMLDIAQYHHEQSKKIVLPPEPTLAEQIDIIAAKVEKKDERLKQAAQTLLSIVPFDFLSITRESASEDHDRYLVKNQVNIFRPSSLVGILEEMGLSMREYKTSKNTAAISRNVFYNNFDFRRLRMDSLWIKALSDHYNFQSALTYRVEAADRYGYFFGFYSTLPEGFNQLQLDLLNKNVETLSAIIDKILIAKEPAETSVRAVRVSSAAAAPTGQPDFHGIVGESPLLKGVFAKIEAVAPDDTSVLISGESGTGKERIAHTIHKLSPRKNKPLVTVNCGALPLTLVESELFGHEKGAFTGASERRIGKFEQADGGTIFLDEVGELPLDAQVKLLRVLQEKEIERLGGNYIKKVNVRIIAATNRNLEREVAEGRFRLDLYYRLNVFPIDLPSLRQRKEDIPLLANYFLQRLIRKSHKAVSGISAEAMETLMNYDWPGNIRELEHLIERSLLMTADDMITEIDIPVYGSAASSLAESGGRTKTLEEMEREHILTVLQQCKGKIFGPGGAAEILNIPSTTLNSKIKKLGIKYEFVK